MSYALVPIRPAKPLANTSALRAAISAGMSQIAQDIRSDLQANTDSWEHPPKWVVLGRADQRDIITADMIYRFQDKGTRAHVIMPKRARRLVFQVPGGTAFATRVNHPGTRAQNWTVVTAEAWQAKVAALMQGYIGRAI